MKEFEKIEIKDLSELPEEIKEMLLKDVAVMAGEMVPEGCENDDSWKALITCLALHKNQVESLQERLDDQQQSMQELAHTVVSFGTNFKALCTQLNKWQEEMGGNDGDSDDDWWKRG